MWWVRGEQRERERVEERDGNLCLELDLGCDGVVVVPGGARVTELEDHLAKEDSAGVHIGHGDDVLCVCVRGHVEALSERVQSKKALAAVMGTSEEGDAVLALHGGGDAVSEELGLGSELAEDGDLVGGGDVVECGHGWVVGDSRERESGLQRREGCVERVWDSPCSAM